jgi:uncharacterized membrane protein YkvA (DUF1232 family)
MQAKAKVIKRELTALYYAYKDPGVPFFPKCIILFTIGYALSPIDLIPDFIPVLGYLDDLLILPSLIILSMKLIPKEVMDKARLQAEKEPLKLKKNWGFAVLFVLIWLIVISAITSSLINALKK